MHSNVADCIIDPPCRFPLDDPNIDREVKLQQQSPFSAPELSLVRRLFAVNTLLQTLRVPHRAVYQVLCQLESPGVIHVKRSEAHSRPEPEDIHLSQVSLTLAVCFSFMALSVTLCATPSTHTRLHTLSFPLFSQSLSLRLVFYFSGVQREQTRHFD